LKLQTQAELTDANVAEKDKEEKNKVIDMIFIPHHIILNIP
jgi:hypothetical protein